MSFPKQENDLRFMRRALRLAARGYGETSPNPLVGAVLTKNGKIIGEGWHQRAGAPHAEIEAILDAESKGHGAKGSTLYVTLEPCSTQGRTGPCTKAIIAAGIARVVTAATDPNPKHRGKGFQHLKNARVEVRHGILSEAAAGLNESFNHWIVHRTPFVTVKSAMTLDGKIATRSGESKWITGPEARAWTMKLRQGADGILVGVNTVLADNPALTIRPMTGLKASAKARRLRRIVLDREARTPLSAQVVSDEFSALTTIVVSRAAPQRRVKALEARVNVWVAPQAKSGIDLSWVLKRLGDEEVTHLLVEGGGEVNASFLLGGHAQRIAFLYAPKILGGSDARKAVAGDGIRIPDEIVALEDVEWRRLGADLLLTARVS